jgi:hypothetical protein
VAVELAALEAVVARAGLVAGGTEADRAGATAARAEAIVKGGPAGGGARQEDLAATMADLVAVNGELWDIEDRIRDCERAGDFGPGFVALARSVYRTNDRRAALKALLNQLCGSQLVEEKSYASATEADATQLPTIPSSPTRSAARQRKRDQCQRSTTARGEVRDEVRGEVPGCFGC